VVSFDDFKVSLAQASPPTGLSVPLQALWWAGKNNWDKAHQLVMGDDSADAAWVHAYLHRVEGDLPNARYWYRQATREPAMNALDAEWAAIVSEFVSR
jgi:hypothetical protein